MTFLKCSILNINDSSYIAKIAASCTSPLRSAPVNPSVLAANSVKFTDESKSFPFKNNSKISLLPFSVGGGI